MFIYVVGKSEGEYVPASPPAGGGPSCYQAAAMRDREGVRHTWYPPPPAAASAGPSRHLHHDHRHRPTSWSSENERREWQHQLPVAPRSASSRLQLMTHTDTSQQAQTRDRLLARTGGAGSYLRDYCAVDNGQDGQVENGDNASWETVVGDRHSANIRTTSRNSCDGSSCSGHSGSSATTRHGPVMMTSSSDYSSIHFTNLDPGPCSPNTFLVAPQYGPRTATPNATGEGGLGTPSVVSRACHGPQLLTSLYSSTDTCSAGYSETLDYGYFPPSTVSIPGPEGLHAAATRLSMGRDRDARECCTTPCHTGVLSVGGEHVSDASISGAPVRGDERLHAVSHASPHACNSSFRLWEPAHFDSDGPDSSASLWCRPDQRCPAFPVVTQLGLISAASSFSSLQASSYDSLESISVDGTDTVFCRCDTIPQGDAISKYSTSSDGHDTCAAAGDNCTDFPPTAVCSSSCTPRLFSIMEEEESDRIQRIQEHEFHLPVLEFGKFLGWTGDAGVVFSDPAGSWGLTTGPGQRSGWSPGTPATGVPGAVLAVPEPSWWRRTRAQGVVPSQDRRLHMGEPETCPAPHTRLAPGDRTSPNSFGRRSPNTARRTSECLTLEASEMIVIDYPDATAMKSASQARAVVSASNIELLLNDGQTSHRPIRRMNSDSVIEQLPEAAACGRHPILVPGEQYQPQGIDHQGNKRHSRASDTSSAYSGSDIMHTSLDDPEAPDVDLSGLAESMVDSDDEEGYAESTESFTIRDAERDCLEKEPSERTEEDIQILLNFTQHFKAFSNMTEHTRRLLCEVMVFAIVPKEGTIVMKDGEEHDAWSVILNGEVEITRPSGVRERLQMGDSFGISPTTEKLYHQGVMKTIVNDCQFVCIAQSSYYRILHQGEENILKHEEKGRVVMVTEHRELDGGSRKGHIVIRGTAERLMQHLVESHSTIDPSYVDDFLLTYRTFLSSPLDLVKYLLDWFKNDELKTNVTRVVLLWVNNHFNDFETSHDMCDFLEHFECLLEREKMMGQLSLLNMACAAKARMRTVTLTRATREEILHFSILGGLERGHGIFVTKVQPQSKAAEAGLKRGDQILEVNGHKFQQMYYNKALEILRGTTHLSITVKSNLQEFKDMLRSSERNTPRKVKREDGNVPNPKQRLSVPDLDSAVQMFSSEHGDSKKAEKRSGIFGTNSRLRKALTRINFMPKNVNGLDREIGSINHSDESLYSKPSRKSSTSSSSSNTGGSTLSNHLSASNPDITSVGLIVDDRNEMPEHVVKVYKSDQSFKYLLIHKETTAKEVVMLALQEFGITDPSCNFSLREVTVEMEKFIKSKRLPDTLSNLPERLNLNGRYYLKNNLTSEPLIPDELVGQLLAESQISLLQLNAHEVAWQLTLNDYRVFREIEPTEYVDDLYGLTSKFGCHQLHKFAELVNKEMFWVVTEICSETNLVKRTKLLKHFIKISKHCKDSKNFNSMFAILSGLGHGSISRLKQTWERLPSKYSKLFQDLQSLMDPSRNMAKYRNLINSEHVQPPYIPFYPIFKKDLTFIHLGNDSYVDSLINFEKLRMIAKEIRHICNICSTKYDSNNMFLSTNNSFQSALVSGMTTLKRTKNRRGSALPNAKKMYEEAQMVRRVRSYLSNMSIISDEEKLTELSNACEAPVRRRDPSPSVNNSPNMEDKRIVTPAGPRFGAESPGAVRKLMALSDKVKPHNPKIPVGKVVSPTANRKGPGGPTSPRIGLSRPVPVNLTPESSCLGAGLRKQPTRTGSMGSTDSASPTGSMRGFKQQYSSENDSGHSSVGSNMSPPQHRRLTAPAGPIYYNMHGHSSHMRPPLPSYSTVMHNSATAMSAPVVSNYSSHPGFSVGRRPPLPDYQAATNMVRRQQQQQQHVRTYSHDSYIGVGHGPVTSSASDCDTPTEGAEEEQVSAV